ncbi:MAG: type IV secretion system protein VirB10 [Candidatus Saccharibacteria bacterium]|nr:type IV secretion system protein VirB10 [Candidatus Saccharibacteria bacterium]
MTDKTPSGDEQHDHENDHGNSMFLNRGDIEEEEVTTKRTVRRVGSSQHINDEDALADDEVPDLNRKTVGGTLAKVLMLTCGGAAVIYMLYMVNTPKAVKAPEAVTVGNNLPPLPTDYDGKPIGIVKAAPSGTSAPEKEKPQDWWERKKLSPLAEEGNQSTSRGKGTIQPTEQQARPERCDPLTQDNCKHRTELSEKLEPAVFKPTVAGMLSDRNYLITSNTSLDATLDTAIDSSEPGLISATLTKDVFSDNHQVKLLERGSRVDGQYSGSVKPGYARLAVIWTRIRTPNGVFINIDSPGADALGRSGMSGNVDNKFWDRFGAAFLLSLFKDTTTYAKNRAVGSNSTSGQPMLDNSTNAVTNTVEKRFEADANIPPVLNKNQGDHIQIMVARDLDFSSVYQLKLNK